MNACIISGMEKPSVSIHFEAKGSISTVLREFKSDFLGSLSEQDLNRTVRLTIVEDGAGPGVEENSDSLRNQIMEVLANDQESFPGGI